MCIIIVVDFVVMISVIIFTGIKEKRMKVVKIFKMAEGGPAQLLSVVFYFSL